MKLHPILPAIHWSIFCILSQVKSFNYLVDTLQNQAKHVPLLIQTEEIPIKKSTGEHVIPFAVFPTTYVEMAENHGLKNEGAIQE